VRFSPRLDSRLIDAIRTADVERMAIADVWRDVGVTAERLGLCRPGYHAVLRLVLEERRRRAARREAILDAADELWSHTGTDYEKLARRLDDTRRS
jgi:hypothetical protein